MLARIKPLPNVVVCGVRERYFNCVKASEQDYYSCKPSACSGFAPDSSECVNSTLRCWTFPKNINSNSGTECQRTSMNAINIWTSAQTDNWRKYEAKNYTHRFQNANSVELLAGSISRCKWIGRAKCPLWYSRHSQACMQPSVPAGAEIEPLRLRLIAFIHQTFSYLQLNSGKKMTR